jgi:hypothetical protein
MVRTHAILFSIAIFCLVPVLIGASVSSAEPNMDLNELPEETPVARVLDRTITLGEINPSQAMIDQNGAGMTAEQLAEWKAQLRQSNLGGYFRPLFERYAEQSEITVTDADIEQYNQAMLRSRERQLNKVQTKTGSLEKELQAKNIDDAVRDELTEQLEMYTRFMEIEEKSKDLYRNNSNPIAGTVIRQWKINQHLYKQYGGRVIFQQAGPEPLDAYRKFLEERQQQGDFEFYNEQAADLFWEYYRNDKMHTFTSDVAEAKKMMETPWWLEESEETLYPELMDVWGDCTDGLSIKIKPKKAAVTTDEDVTVTLGLLNIGQRTYSCAFHEQFFEIEMDGKWYRWNGPQAIDILAAFAEPNTVQYESTTLELTDQWHSLEIDKPLALEEGSHYLRLRYQPMGIRLESEAGLQEIASTFWVTSNLQTIEIIEQPLTIIVEGQIENTLKIVQWLAKNPGAVKSVFGQSYWVTTASLKTQPGNKITALPNESDINFKIKIMDASGNRMASELEKKLTELIREQMQE